MVAVEAGAGGVGTADAVGAVFVKMLVEAGVGEGRGC
jgi:hypothetical protein